MLTQNQIKAAHLQVKEIIRTATSSSSMQERIQRVFDKLIAQANSSPDSEATFADEAPTDDLS